jgi:hypothetical protein
MGTSIQQIDNPYGPASTKTRSFAARSTLATTFVD